MAERHSKTPFTGIFVTLPKRTGRSPLEKLQPPNHVARPPLEHSVLDPLAQGVGRRAPHLPSNTMNEERREQRSTYGTQTLELAT